MEESSPSNTAAGAAMLRAAHVLVDGEPKLFRDEWAHFFLDERMRASASNLDVVGTDITRASRSTVNARLVITEAETDAFVANGGTQIVVLGAGYDSFALRRTDLADRVVVYEVDHPLTQAAKRAKLREGGVDEPANVRFVAVNFETDDLGEQLVRAGWRKDQPSFFSWLGVTMYLTDSATFHTFDFVASCARGSVIVCQYAVTGPTVAASDLDIRNRAAQGVASRGEPWINFYEPSVLVSRLYDSGFTAVDDLRAEQLQPLFIGRTDGLWWPTTNGMIVGRV